MSKFLHFTLLLGGVLTAQVAAADDTPGINRPDAYGISADLAMRHVQGYREPDTDEYQHPDALRKKLTALIQRKVALVATRENNTMSTGDYIAAAILPGGLLYAGYKQREYYLANKDLAEVNAEIDRYVDHLDALQPAPGSMVLAPQHLVDVDGSVHPF